MFIGRHPSPSRRTTTRVALAAITAVVVSGTPLPALASTVKTKRVSVSSGGAQANSPSYDPSISADGRFVAFDSYASNLVSEDTNGSSDVFVFDRRTHRTRRVSVNSGGAQGNGESYDPSISADGRFVGFDSGASTLVRGDTNSSFDVFVYDRKTQRTRRVSVSSGGAQGNNYSWSPSISADGRFVAFYSDASNLVRGDTNGSSDVFVYDRKTQRTRRVSVSSGGTQGNDESYGPSISADGRLVAFTSSASNLVRGDTNGAYDVFVHDQETHRTRRVSISSGGAQGNDESSEPSISTDGRFVAFDSDASNLVGGDTNGSYDVFLYDRKAHRTRRVSVSSGGTQANDQSFEPSVSAGGRLIAFVSDASNLVRGDTDSYRDAFVYHRKTQRTRRVSVSSSGAQANSGSYYFPSISADGRFVAFDSPASNLVGGDTNGVSDVFVRGPLR